MSVINQMLRDLEERKLKETSSEHYIDEVNIIARRTISPWWLILPVIIIIVVAINVYLHFLNNQSGLMSTEQQSLIVIESIVQDLPAKIADIKPKAVTHHIVLKEADSAINKAVPSSSKKEQHEIVIEPIIEKPLEQARKTVITADDKITEKENIEINHSTENNVSTKNQKAEEKKPSDSSSLKLKIKSPVNTRVKIRKKDTLLNAETIMYQARLLMADDQTGAIQLLESNIKKISPDADYYALLANLNQRRQNYDNAIVYYRKALEMSPHKGEIWIGIALAYQSTGEENNAVAAFKQALTTDDLSLELRAYVRQQMGL